MKPVPLAVALLLSSACLHTADTPQREVAPPDPPPMPLREIAPSSQPLPGESIDLQDGETRFTLFVPETWNAGVNGVTLAVHFHTATRFAIEEHLRRGLEGPLIVANFGSGSSVYRRPFEDRQRFNRWLRLVEAELRRRETSGEPRITSVDVSSFSAGYGAVRELVKSPEHVELIRRIVLCDSLYGSLAADSNGKRRPAAEHIGPWIPFVQAAQRGEKTFVLTYSQVPTGTYASTAECAAGIVEAVGLQMAEVPPGSNAASADSRFPLIFRADAGNLHVWGYAGGDARAHTTHVRHLADVWKALDAAGKP